MLTITEQKFSFVQLRIYEERKERHKMGVSVENLSKAQPKDIFCVTRHDIFFFDENNCFASSWQQSGWQYSESFVKAVNHVAERRLIEAGYAWQNRYILDESSYAYGVLRPLIGLSQDDFYFELKRKGNASTEKREKLKSEAEYDIRCREKYPSLFAKTGPSILLPKPMLDVRLESFELVFSLKRYAFDDSASPISILQYGQWFRKRKKEFFSFVKMQINHYEQIKWKIGDISYYKLSDCVVKADSTISLIFSVKPELIQILDEAVSD